MVYSVVMTTTNTTETPALCINRAQGAHLAGERSRTCPTCITPAEQRTGTETAVRVVRGATAADDIVIVQARGDDREVICSQFLDTTIRLSPESTYDAAEDPYATEYDR